MARWKIDPDHSVGSFAIRHMTVAFVHGQINRVSGSIDFAPDDFSSLAVELSIETEGIITGIAKRDEHLKSADFFEVATYPAIMFKSSRAEKTAFNSVRVSGEITIHGIQKEIDLEIDLLGPVKSPFGETTIGLSGSMVLDRTDFGMNWNEPMEKGGFMVGNNVEVSINIEADLEE